MKNKMINIALVSSAVLLGTVFATQNVSANTNEQRITQEQNAYVPEMSLDQALETGQEEVIIDDLGNSVLGQTLKKMENNMIMARGAGRWVYKYTAQPYAFYYHTGTKKWKMVQVTPTSQHVINTVVNGWASSAAGAGNYFSTKYRG